MAYAEPRLTRERNREIEETEDIVERTPARTVAVRETKWKVKDSSLFKDENKLAGVKIEHLSDLVALLERHETLVLEKDCLDSDVIHVETTNMDVRVDDGYPEDDWW